MKLFLYAAAGRKQTEHDMAYRLLALAVEKELGLRPLPEIAREAGGKPFFPARHSRGAAVCALHNRPVGVDMEKIRPAPKHLSAGLTDEAFFRLWTAKEATIKRQGLGIGALLQPFTPDPLCRCVEDLLEGYLITVCPSEAAEIQAVRIE